MTPMSRLENKSCAHPCDPYFYTHVQASHACLECGKDGSRHRVPSPACHGTHARRLVCSVCRLYGERLYDVAQMATGAAIPHTVASSTQAYACMYVMHVCVRMWGHNALHKHTHVCAHGDTIRCMNTPHTNSDKTRSLGERARCAASPQTV